MASPTGGGTFDLLGWGALQTGRWGVLTQRSGAGAIEAGFQPKFVEKVRPWFRGGYYYSSGDGNPTDGTHGTFFAILPTPRVYARFPFFNSMNNRDLFGEVMLRPGKRLTIRSDVHGLWLASSKDLGIPAVARTSRGRSAFKGARRMGTPASPHSTTSAVTTSGVTEFPSPCTSDTRWEVT